MSAKDKPVALVRILSSSLPGYGVHVSLGDEEGARLTTNSSLFQLFEPGLDGSNGTLSFRWIKEEQSDIFNESFNESFLCAKAGKVSLVESPETKRGTFRLLRSPEDAEEFRIVPSAEAEQCMYAEGADDRLLTGKPVASAHHLFRYWYKEPNISDEDPVAVRLTTHEAPKEKHGSKSDSLETTETQEKFLTESLEESNQFSDSHKKTNYDQADQSHESHVEVEETLEQKPLPSEKVEGPPMEIPSFGHIVDYWKDVSIQSSPIIGRRYSERDIIEGLRQSSREAESGEEEAASNDQCSLAEMETIFSTLDDLDKQDVLAPGDYEIVVGLLKSLDSVPPAAEIFQIPQPTSTEGQTERRIEEIDSEPDVVHSVDCNKGIGYDQPVECNVHDTSSSPAAEEGEAFPSEKYETTHVNAENQINVVDKPCPLVSSNLLGVGSTFNDNDSINNEQIPQEFLCLPCDEVSICSDETVPEVLPSVLTVADNEHIDCGSYEAIPVQQDMKSDNYGNDKSSATSEEGEETPLLSNDPCLENANLQTETKTLQSVSVSSLVETSIDMESAAESPSNGVLKIYDKVQTTSPSSPRPSSLLNRSESDYVSLPLNSESIAREFFLRYAETLDLCLCFAVEKFEQQLGNSKQEVFDMIGELEHTHPCLVPCNDGNLNVFVENVIENALIPSLIDFKEMLVIETDDLRTSQGPRIVIPRNAFRNARRRFTMDDIIGLVRHEVLAALKEVKPENPEATPKLVIENLDARFSDTDTGKEILNCVWKQMVNVLSYCRVSPLPAEIVISANVGAPIEFVIDSMLKELKSQVNELLDITVVDQVEGMLSKPPFTASPALFVLNQLLAVSKVSLMSCHLRSGEAMLLTIEDKLRKEETDARVGQMLQDMLLQVDPNLVIQPSAILTGAEICEGNTTTALEQVIRGTYHRERFTEMVFKYCNPELLNHPLPSTFAEMFHFNGGIRPLTLAAVISGPTLIKRLCTQGAIFDLDDGNGNILHDLVSMYFVAEKEGSPWPQTQIIDALHFAFKTFKKWNNERLMQQRNSIGLTPLELAAKHDCARLFDVMVETLKIEQNDSYANTGLYDVTDIDRNAFRAAKTAAPSVPHSKSINSQFAFDIICSHPEDSPTVWGNCLIRTLAEDKAKKYSVYYFGWQVIHALLMVVMTVSAIYRPLRGDSLVNHNNNDLGVNVRLLGDVLLLIYSLFTLSMEIFDTWYFSDPVSFILSVSNGIKALRKGAKRPRMVWYECKAASHHFFLLHSWFRVSFFLFSVLSCIVFILRLVHAKNESHVLTLTLVLGWSLLFFFSDNNYFSSFLSCAAGHVAQLCVPMTIFLFAFSSAFYVAVQDIESLEHDTFGEVLFLFFRLPVTSERLSSKAGKPYPLLAILVYCAGLLVLFVLVVCLLIARFVKLYDRISPEIDAISRRHKTAILLLIERRLPPALRLRNVFVKNGRAFALHSGHIPRAV